jgi:hypothetical protein
MISSHDLRGKLRAKRRRLRRQLRREELSQRDRHLGEMMLKLYEVVGRTLRPEDRVS